MLVNANRKEDLISSSDCWIISWTSLIMRLLVTEKRQETLASYARRHHGRLLLHRDYQHVIPKRPGPLWKLTKRRWTMWFHTIGQRKRSVYQDDQPEHSRSHVTWPRPRSDLPISRSRLANPSTQMKPRWHHSRRSTPSVSRLPHLRQKRGVRS